VPLACLGGSTAKIGSFSSTLSASGSALSFPAADSFFLAAFFLDFYPSPSGSSIYFPKTILQGNFPLPLAPGGLI